MEAAAAAITVGDWARAARLAGAVASTDPVIAAGASMQLARARWFAGDAAGAHAAVTATSSTNVGGSQAGSDAGTSLKWRTQNGRYGPSVM